MKNAIDAMVNEIVRIMDGDVYGIWLYGSVVMVQSPCAKTAGPKPNAVKRHKTTKRKNFFILCDLLY